MHKHSYEASGVVAFLRSLLSKLPLPKARDLLRKPQAAVGNILRKLRSQWFIILNISAIAIGRQSYKHNSGLKRYKLHCCLASG